MECALRALRHRDRTQAEIEEHLRARGFREAERTDALGTLLRTGLIDDGRLAFGRATSLAERGAGDRLIRARLAEAGVAAELAADAIRALEPEAARARRIAAGRGLSPKTARYLYAKGFSEDAVNAAIADGDGGELG